MNDRSRPPVEGLNDAERTIKISGNLVATVPTELFPAPHQVAAQIRLLINVGGLALFVLHQVLDWWSCHAGDVHSIFPVPFSVDEFENQPGNKRHLQNPDRHDPTD